METEPEMQGKENVSLINQKTIPIA